MAYSTIGRAADFGYDPEVVGPTIAKAETRVRRYLASRSSATVMLASDPLSDGLAELILSVAQRMAVTSEQVATGITSESAGQQTVSYGAQAYAGTTDLTSDEKATLDRMCPKRPFAIDTLEDVDR